ncbi:MAG: hypothetical protein IKX60_03045, partial [Bacteroidales bacterium]|nr:hypothetical protein [Bacteroidales bacterium]
AGRLPHISVNQRELYFSCHILLFVVKSKLREIRTNIKIVFPKWKRLLPLPPDARFASLHGARSSVG